MLIKKLFEANNPEPRNLGAWIGTAWAEGYRSIGHWLGIMDTCPDTLRHMGLNDHQVGHAQKIHGHYGVFILMKESYAEKWRIHSPISFAYFFLCNIRGKIDSGEELNGYDKELKSICQSVVLEDI